MEIIISLAILVLGFILGFITRKIAVSKKIKSAKTKAEKIIEETKAKQKRELLNAQEKAIKIIEEAKKEERRRNREIKEQQNRLERKENIFSKKLFELQAKQTKLYEKITRVEEVKKRINEIKKEQLEKLEKIAGMKKEQAGEVLMKNIESQMKESILSRIRKLENEGAEEIEKKSRSMLLLAMERMASPLAAESTTSTVGLPNDEMKGRIIGREGRNIKAIEQSTGVEIIVDDTPNTITLSAFSPIRREIAKRALEKLILDGRIHPARIESTIEEAKKQVALDIKKAGEEAMYEVGVTGFDPKLVQILGRLKYRTSYGQNVLQHSIEVANLSALIAEELGADVTLAKKAGLLHDIGKALDQEIKGTHMEIGRDIAKKFHLSDKIINPILTHHDDKPADLMSVIVKVADAISGAREGARKDTYERYLQRLEELENVAKNFDGVEKVYAIQAGREIRVFVMPDKIDDLEAHNLARKIAHQIEIELKYPGEIKVNVIREMRVIEYAR